MWGRTGRKRTGCVPGVGVGARRSGGDLEFRRDLSGDRTGAVRTGGAAFVSGVWVTDADRDGRSELQVLRSAGDGMTARHIGRQHGGGVSVGGEEFRGADGPGAELGQPAFPACAAR